MGHTESSTAWENCRRVNKWRRRLDRCAYLIIDAREPLPAVLARVRPKHGVEAEDVRIGRHQTQHDLLRVPFHREHIDDELTLEQLGRQQRGHLLNGMGGAQCMVCMVNGVS